MGENTFLLILTTLVKAMEFLNNSIYHIPQAKMGYWNEKCQKSKNVEYVQDHHSFQTILGERCCHCMLS